MNKLTIIGNLTRDPELRTVGNGIAVCNFTVAVNRRRGQNDNGQPEADFFSVAAWRQQGENCAKYLAKGRKVCVVGPVSARTYQANDGSTRVQLEVTAEDVEFLSSRNEVQAADPQEQSYQRQERQAMQTEMAGGFTEVETDDLPF